MIYQSFLNEIHPMQVAEQNIQLTKHTPGAIHSQSTNKLPTELIWIILPLKMINSHLMRKFTSAAEIRLQESPPNKDEYAN